MLATLLVQLDYHIVPTQAESRYEMTIQKLLNLVPCTTANLLLARTIRSAPYDTKQVRVRAGEAAGVSVLLHLDTAEAQEGILPEKCQQDQSGEWGL